MTCNKLLIHTLFKPEYERLLELRFKEMGKRLERYVQQRRTDINSFKSENLITPVDCIKYNQSEYVKGTISELLF